MVRSFLFFILFFICSISFPQKKSTVITYPAKDVSSLLLQVSPSFDESEFVEGDYNVTPKTKVNVLEMVDYYWVKVMVNKRIGFIPLKMLELNSKMLSLYPADSRERSLVKKYGNKIALRIINEEIWLGMTTEMAKASWGTPKDINRSVYTFAVHEQWVYDGSYLYFENGRLTSWQD